MAMRARSDGRASGRILSSIRGRHWAGKHGEQALRGADELSIGPSRLVRPVGMVIVRQIRAKELIQAHAVRVPVWVTWEVIRMASTGNTGQTHQVETRAVSDRFLRALEGRDFPALAACFTEDTQFRALLPQALRTASGVNESTRYFQQWFGAADRVELLASSTAPIGDRQHLAWRLRVHGATGRHVIEQQAFATIRDDRIVELDLLCSGFRPEQASSDEANRESQETPLPVAAVLEGAEAHCATLTPLIKAKLSELASGELLEVITSEPSAGRDIVSWSKLTGNPLLATYSVGAERHFYVRKK